MMRAPRTSPFAGTARHYRHRAPYAPEAFAFLADTFGLSEGARVLDLGCGPGTLTIPLSRLAGEVLAIDRDAGMIAEGRRRASEAGRTNITWRRMSAEEISPTLGVFTLAVMGQSFHWMDRDVVLERLGEIICDGGGVAVVNPGWRRPQESWEDSARVVVDRYLGAGTQDRRHPAANPEPDNDPSLRRSAFFHDLRMKTFTIEFTRDSASVVGYLYSTSFAARRRFGARAAVFEVDLEAALKRLSPSGQFHERVETNVAYAFKGSIARMVNF
jgi:SAM-dependent methyltransferase